MKPEFAALRDAQGRVDFDLHAAWSPSMHRAFLGSGADGLVANYARGFAGRDIAFVRGLPLRRLTILDRGIADLTPVHDLGSTLEELSVHVAPGAFLDLTLLPRLRVLACAWDQVRDTIGATDRLEDLYLSPYREEDMTPLSHLTSLRSLRMKERPGVRALDGVEAMPWLTHLGVYGAPLEDTGALSRLASPVLTRLDVASCRRITSLVDVGCLVGLRELDVSDGGPLASVGPIAGLTQLERLDLHGSTTIADGDLTPLLSLGRLRDLRLMNRRHYDPTVDTIRARLGIQH